MIRQGLVQVDELASGYPAGVTGVAGEEIEGDEAVPAAPVADSVLVDEGAHGLRRAGVPEPARRWGNGQGVVRPAGRGRLAEMPDPAQPVAHDGFGQVRF